MDQRHPTASWSHKFSAIFNMLTMLIMFCAKPSGCMAPGRALMACSASVRQSTIINPLVPDVPGKRFLWTTRSWKQLLGTFFLSLSSQKNRTKNVYLYNYFRHLIKHNFNQIHHVRSRRVANSINQVRGRKVFGLPVPRVFGHLGPSRKRLLLPGLKSMVTSAANFKSRERRATSILDQVVLVVPETKRRGPRTSLGRHATMFWLECLSCSHTSSDHIYIDQCSLMCSPDLPNYPKYGWGYLRSPCPILWCCCCVT